MSSPDGAGSDFHPGPGYEALNSSVAAWVDPDRVFLRVAGARVDGVLNGLLSADVTVLQQPGDSTLSFVLTSKGRPVAVPRVLRLEDSILLDVSREAVTGLLDHFGTYLPPRFAAVTALDDMRRVSLLGPRADDVEATLDLSESPLRLERAPEEGGGVDFYVPAESSARDEIETATLAAGGAMATAADYEAWRMELGIPRFGLDITADNLPQETGLVSRAVSFDKGCYTGQEVVARIHYRGQVNRHLSGIRPTDPASAPPGTPGAELTREGRVVGTITSWCVSPRLGPIGLGYVRRELSAGDVVEAEFERPFSCVVTDLPFTSA